MSPEKATSVWLGLLVLVSPEKATSVWLWVVSVGCSSFEERREEVMVFVKVWGVDL